MKTVQKILLASVILLFFLFFKSPVFAQNQAVTTNYQTRDLNVWTQNVMMEVMSSFSCQLAGINFTHKAQQCIGIDPKTGEIGFVENGHGALGLLSGGIAMLFKSPVHTGDYVSYLSQNFGIAKKSYAATTAPNGVGFESVIPLIPIWGVFRDISYLLFIIIFIVIGLAIMLRAKIDPRTVMTIQNQIPKLIIGIIMVTFSLPIAGLLIDLMWASTYVVIGVAYSANHNISREKATEQLYDNPFSYFDATGAAGDQNSSPLIPNTGGVFNTAQRASGSIQGTLNSSFGQAPPPNSAPQPKDECIGNPLGVICYAIGATRDIGGNLANAVFKIVTLDWGGLLADSVGTVLSGILGFFVSWIIGGLAFFIIVILLIWNLFKLWIALLKTYIKILIDIVFAPFWIMGGLLPGSSSLGLTGWLKDLLGNLAVFPAIVGLFLLAKVFLDMSTKDGFFTPPLIGNFTGGANTLGPLIALGFVLAAPHVVDGVKKSIKEKFSLDLSGVGDSLKTGQGMGTTFLSIARARLYKEHKDQAGVIHKTGLLVGRVNTAQGRFNSIRGRFAAKVPPVITNAIKKIPFTPPPTPPVGKRRKGGPGTSGQSGGGRTSPQTPPATGGGPGVGPTGTGGGSTGSSGATTVGPNPRITVVNPPTTQTPPTTANLAGGAAASLTAAQTQTDVRDLRKRVGDLPRNIVDRLRRRQP